jgi:hypothetical protein
MIVDYDGRILAQADPGPGDKIVVGPISLDALREERDRRQGHHMLAHMRMEAYEGYRQSIYPGGKAGVDHPVTVEQNRQAILSGLEALSGNRQCSSA